MSTRIKSLAEETKIETLEVYKGTDEKWEFDIVFVKGLGPKNLDDISEIFFTVKQNFTDTAELFQKSLGGGITKLSPAVDGIISVTVTKDDTDLEPGDYQAELRVTADGQSKIVGTGILKVLPRVSN